MENEDRFSLGITHNGKTIPSGVPYLKIKLIGVNLPKSHLYHNGIEAILDTGAVNTHITPQFAKELNLQATDKDIGLYPLAEGVSETNIYRMDFIIHGIEAVFSENFKEMPYGFQFPIIFGTEFLMKCRSLKIDFIEKSYVLEI